MVCSIEQVAGTHHFVATIEGFEMITDGINIQVVKIVPQRMQQFRRSGDRGRGSTMRLKASFKVRDDATYMSDNQLKSGASSKKPLRISWSAFRLLS
jgi:hypothetical protein